MTTKTAKHIRPRRSAPARHSWMESLGFSDTPSVSYVSAPMAAPVAQAAPSRLVSTATHRVTTVEEMWETTELHAESMIDWRPDAVDNVRLNKRIRWKIVLLWTLIVAVLGGVGYWIYQAPAASAEQAVEQLGTDGEALAATLEPLAEVVGQLTADADEFSLALSEATARTDQASRVLFESAAAIPDAENGLRSTATNAATNALEASKIVNGLVSYLGAAMPILTGPALETDPELIELADAAAQFADWQSRFDSVRIVLPDSVFSGTSDGFAALSSDLPAIQTAYLDALRTDNREGALTAIRNLEAGLSEVWASMNTETESLKLTVLDLLDQTRDALALLAR